MTEGREVGIEKFMDNQSNIVIVDFIKNTSAKEQFIYRRTATKIPLNKYLGLGGMMCYCDVCCLEYLDFCEY